MRNRRYLLAIFLVMTAGALAARGQSQPERQQQPTRQGETARPASQDEARGQTRSNSSEADQTFVREAAEGGMTEVALGRLALERASGAEVKQFARRMIDDHAQANQELMRLAQSKGVTLPQGMTDTQSGAQGGRDQAGQQTNPQTGQQAGTQTRRQSDQRGGEPKPVSEAVERLSRHSGAEFDREFMGQMVKDHDKTVALFERQAQSGSDAELKGFAAKTLPTLREHAQMARELAAKVGAPTSSDRQ